MRSELTDLLKAENTGNLSALQEQRFKYLLSKKVQDYLDNGFGECWLGEPRVAEIVREALVHHDGDSYITHACCIMPNHLHWVLTPVKRKGMGKLDSLLIPIVQRFKSFTAHTANKILERSGPFWAREYYDHLIRSSEEFGRIVQYTLQNPVKAKLCSEWKAWDWTICSETIRNALADDQVTDARRGSHIGWF